jgi:replicative DNA helicase
VSDPTFERPLPNSAEAERAVLGAILLNSELIHQATTELLPEQFYVPSHRRIFEAMQSIAAREMAVDSVLVIEHLSSEGSLESTGGQSFISNLTYGLPFSANIAHYARVIRKKAMLRQLIKSCSKITADALDEDDDPESILERAQEQLFALGVQINLSTRQPRTYNEISASVMQLFGDWADGNIVAIPTQIPELDHRLAYGGLSAQDFIIIAARSSFGKTALALQIGLNVARAGQSVLIISLEMSGEKLFIRNLSSVTSVPHRQIKPWTFQHDRDLSGQILHGVGKLQDCPIQVEDRIHELSRVGAIARDWKRRNQTASLVIVDYLQLVKNKQDKRSRQEEVAGVSTEMKRLAQELNVPVIGVSQFNRDPARQNRRPELSDLRESGQLEQDADVVLFPWSEDGLKDQEVRGMKLYCAKQRNGSVGWEIPIDFDGEKQWFFTEQLYRDARFA